MNNPTLVVDLDHTLLRTDSLWESLYAAVFAKPWLIPLMPLWLLGGKAHFKAKIASHWNGTVRDWPYNQAVIAEIEAARKDGRAICLSTAANEKIALLVAEHLDLRAVVLASGETTNLRGNAKRDRLIADFGEKNFDYIADSPSDLPVWAVSRQAIVVADGETGLVRKVRRINSHCRIVPAGDGGVRAYLNQIRVHQWVKNALVAIPIVFTRSLDLRNILAVFLGMLCFSFLSSLIYIVNDLADLQSDRMHAQKRSRPFASGAIPLWSGPILTLLLAGAVAIIAIKLPPGFRTVLVVYFVLNVLYSWFLKRVLMLDVVILMTFYVIRIMAGDILIGMPHSNWMIGFACFVFLGLSLVKRVAELMHQEASGSDKAHGRAYINKDKSILMVMAAASGFCSLTILALYIDSLQATRAFLQPKILWLLCPLIGYWYGRILILTNRGKMLHDPVRFVLTDPISLFTMGVGIVFVFMAAF